MKQLLFLALITLTIAACSKKSSDTVTPDAVSVVSGTYTMNYYRLDSAGVKLVDTNLPVVSQSSGLPIASGTMVITKAAAANSVNVTYNLLSTGSKPETLDFGDFTLQASGTSYDLYYSTTKYGSLDGTNLSYDETFTGSDGVTYHLLINATKPK